MKLGRSVSASAKSVFAPEAGHKKWNRAAGLYSRFLIVFLTIFLLGPSINNVVFGQVETGSISGTVKDVTGGVIPDAKVTAKSVDRATERSVDCGQDGVYVITGLNPGLYDVTITSGNFAPFVGHVEVTVSGSGHPRCTTRGILHQHDGRSYRRGRNLRKYADPGSFAGDLVGSDRGAAEPDA